MTGLQRRLREYVLLTRLDRPIGILLLLSAVYGSRPQQRVGYPREDLYV